MTQVRPRRRTGVRYVAAGVVYLVLSSALVVLWLTVNHVLVLLVAFSTAIAGLVDLSVGWPRVRREWSSRMRPR